MKGVGVGVCPAFKPVIRCWQLIIPTSNWNCYLEVSIQSNDYSQRRAILRSPRPTSTLIAHTAIFLKKALICNMALHGHHSVKWKAKIYLFLYLFFFSCVLPQVQEIKDVTMPWFQVYSKGTRSLIASLVNIPCSRIVNTQHWYQTVWDSIGLVEMEIDKILLIL